MSNNKNEELTDEEVVEWLKHIGRQIFSYLIIIPSVCFLLWAVRESRKNDFLYEQDKIIVAGMNKANTCDEQLQYLDNKDMEYGLQYAERFTINSIRFGMYIAYGISYICMDSFYIDCTKLTERHRVDVNSYWREQIAKDKREKEEQRQINIQDHNVSPDSYLTNQGNTYAH